MIQLLYDMLDIYPGEVKTCAHSKTFSQMFIATLCVKIQYWKQLRCPSMTEWLNSVQLYNGILLRKKEWITEAHNILNDSLGNYTY